MRAHIANMSICMVSPGNCLPQQSFSSELVGFLRCCMHTDVTLRSTAAELLDHSFVATRGAMRIDSAVSPVPQDGRTDSMVLFNPPIGLAGVNQAMPSAEEPRRLLGLKEIPEAQPQTANGLHVNLPQESMV